MRKVLNKKRTIVGTILILLLGWLSVSIISDLKSNAEISMIPGEKPAGRGNINQVLFDLMNGDDYDSAHIQSVCGYMDGRYDCTDFDTPSLMRILYEYPDKLRPDDLKRLKKTVLDFKYWMTDPGKDSKCYWSENHQILHSAAEYLAGELYPEEIFTNTGMTGREHAQRGRERVLTWLRQRWNHGYIEWFSNTYYKEDIRPLAVLCDFAAGEEVRIKANIIMDLMMYDLASQSFKGTFVTTTGRGYEMDRMSGLHSSVKSETEAFFGYDVDPSSSVAIDMGLNLRYSETYEMPPVFYEIAHDEQSRVIKGSSGLDIDELKALDLIGQEDRQIMMQWGMESFSNPQTIANSIKYIETHGMFENAFLHGFKDVNFTFLKTFNLLPLLSKVLNPQSNGVAIQRANTYMYRTLHYSLYTTQNYHPGDYGDQQHVAGMTLSNDLSVFHSHPAVEAGSPGANGNSPTYWVGYGHLPHSVQHENINLSIYNIPKKKGRMEKELLGYTHAYFPEKLFDESSIEGRIAFGRKGDAYVAFITPGDLSYRKHDKKHKAGGVNYDLILQGKEVYWITEASERSADGGFDAFKQRIRKQAESIRFDGKKLIYRSRDALMELNFSAEFLIDNQRVDLQYNRYDSPYVQSKRMPETLRFNWNEKELYLNFDQLIRIYN